MMLDHLIMCRKNIGMQTAGRLCLTLSTVPFDNGAAFLTAVLDCNPRFCFYFFKLIMPHTPYMVALRAVAVGNLFFGYNEVTIGTTNFVFRRLNEYQFLVLTRSHR